MALRVVVVVIVVVVGSYHLDIDEGIEDRSDGNPQVKIGMLETDR